MESDFGKYELLEKIGTGGMAEVYLAKSFGAEGLEKILVIKRILPDYTSNRRFVDMFISEAKIAVDLNHPNIVQIYDFGKVDDMYFLAMEFVDGCDLAMLLSGARRADINLSVGNAVYLGVEIAKGLDYAHRRQDRYGEPLGIVHRDISPQNILVSRDGTAKIVDFGIAKASSVTDESPHIVKGKFSYMSPEQASGRKVDQRSDLFSAGVVLFEMLCGRPLFRHTTQEETLSMVKSAVVPDISSLNPQIPPDLEELLYRVLTREPEDRIQTARELQVELTKILYSQTEIHDSATLSRYLRELEPYLTGDEHEDATAIASNITTFNRTASTGAKTATGGTMAQSTTTPVTRIAAEERGPPELRARERKECVIISGRLHGLFELRQNLGQDAWLQVLQEYTRIVDSIAYKNDAVVHRVNEDGFVVLLGIPVSSENDAERAARVSVDLHEAVAGMNPSLDIPIQLSVGIAIGDVVLEQEVDKTGRRFSWSFYGGSHELADRLASSAMAKEILLGGQVFRRIKREYICEKVDSVSTPEDEDQTPQEIQAWRLVEPKSQQDKITEVRHAYHSFYGRELMLKELRERFRGTMLEEKAHAILVVGRPGIGKSTLVEEFLRGLDPRNVRVLRGVVPAYERDVPLACLASLLAEMLRLGDRDDLRQVRDTLSTRITALFTREDTTEQEFLLHSLGALFNIRFPDGQFDELLGDERRDRIFMSIQKLLVNFAEHKPLILTIDDAHYLDSMSLEFGTEFFGMSQDAKILLLMTADDGPLVQGDQWDAFAEANHTSAERLSELPDHDAEKLVDELLRHHRIDDEGLAEEILRRSGGNPLYIKEVVEVLRDRGMLKDTGERRQIKMEEESAMWLPSNVDGILRARIDRLDLSLKVALQKVALLWTPFSGADLDLVLPEDSNEKIEELVEVGLLERADHPQTAAHQTYDPNQTPLEERQYRFCNALTQDVAARGLMPEEAAVIHRKLADHLVEHGEERQIFANALIAHHFDGAGQKDRSVEYYYQAAGKALDQFGAAEALRLTDKVLDRVDDESEYRFGALKIRARALNELGERAGAEKALAEIEGIAESLEDPIELADVLLKLARFKFEDSEMRVAREYMERARKLAEGEDDRLHLAESWYIDALITSSEGSRDGSLELAERAVEQYEQLQDTKPGGEVLEGLVTALNLVGVVHRQSGRYADALEAYERALGYADGADLKKNRRYLLTNAGVAHAYLGEFNRALECYEEALQQCKRLGHRREEAGLLVNVGHAHLLRGDLETAISTIRRGNYLARKTNTHHVLADGLISLGACYVESGDMSKAESTLQEGLRIADSIPNVYLSVHATLLLAQVNLAAGTQDAARIAHMQAEDAVERSENSMMRWGVSHGNSLMARALKAQGKRERAIKHSKRAMELVNDGEIYAIDEILYYHFQILPDDEEYESERVTAMQRAREVVLHRRDLIEDEEGRQLFMSRNIVRQILNVAKVALD